MRIFGYEIRKVKDSDIIKKKEDRFFSFLNRSGRKQLKKFVINAERLELLYKTDPITWSIVKTIKSVVNGVDWDIVPDTNKITGELMRLKQYALLDLNGFEIIPKFFSSILSEETRNIIIGEVLNIIKGEGSKREKIDRIDMFIKLMETLIEQEAMKHCNVVKKVFETPNNHLQTSWEVMQDYILADLLVHDAGVIAKNYDLGGKLAEVYALKGSNVKRYLYDDYTIPSPPEPAFVYERNGFSREYTKDELVYISQNPQYDGYGLSPLEVACYVIAGSLYADSYNIDFFKNSNVPVGVFDLGADIDEETRAVFEQMWNQQITGKSLYRIAFISGAGGDKKFIPIQSMTHREMQFMEYLKWTTCVKCACFGLSPQDVGIVQDFHRTTAETQKELTKMRGIRNILRVCASAYNQELVKKEFDFDDVKFVYQEIDIEDKKARAEIDDLDIRQGIISRNERRKRLGLPPVVGGDVITITTPQGLVPIETLGQLEHEVKQKLLQLEGQLQELNVKEVKEGEGEEINIEEMKRVVKPMDFLQGLLNLREDIEKAIQERKNASNI